MPSVRRVAVVVMVSACTTVRQPAPDIRPELITTGEFTPFIAEFGYGRQELWTERGWTWRTRSSIGQPQGWKDSEMQADSDPVTGISWYEADAFCRFTGKHLPPLEPREVATLAEQMAPAPQATPRVRGPVRTLESSTDPYLQTVRRAIQSKWTYPCVRTSPSVRCEYKPTLLVVQMGIAKNGDLVYVDLISSSGYSTMDEVAINAVRRAAPFPPVPDVVSDSGIPIWTTFVYVVTGPLGSLPEKSLVLRPRVQWEWVGIGPESGIVRQFRDGPERLHLMRNPSDGRSVLVPAEVRTRVVGFRCVEKQP